VLAALAFVALLAMSAFVPLLQPGDTVPPVPLIDQSGHAFSLARLRGNAVVLTFIYTRCADAHMCPLVSLKYARMQQALRAAPAPVRLVELTLDPRFDTPAVLRRYGTAYRADARAWTLATGAPDSLADLAARLGIASQWTQPGTLVHTEAAIVLDRNGAIVQTIDGNDWTPDGMLAIARGAAGETPAPLANLGAWLTAAVERCGGGTVPLSTFELLALIVVLSLAFAAMLFRSMRPSGGA
jgi:cytochrome oxidase Cu insertion factor (SCO1/SenC/PrrC family)